MARPACRHPRTVEALAARRDAAGAGVPLRRAGRSCARAPAAPAPGRPHRAGAPRAAPAARGRAGPRPRPPDPDAPGALGPGRAGPGVGRGARVGLRGGRRHGRRRRGRGRGRLVGPGAPRLGAEPGPRGVARRRGGRRDAGPHCGRACRGRQGGAGGRGARRPLRRRPRRELRRARGHPRPPVRRAPLRRRRRGRHAPPPPSASTRACAPSPAARTGCPPTRTRLLGVHRAPAPAAVGRPPRRVREHRCGRASRRRGAADVGAPRRARRRSPCAGATAGTPSDEATLQGRLDWGEHVPPRTRRRAPALPPCSTTAAGVLGRRHGSPRRRGGSPAAPPGRGGRSRAGSASAAASRPAPRPGRPAAAPRPGRPRRRVPLPEPGPPTAWRGSRPRRSTAWSVDVHVPALVRSGGPPRPAGLPLVLWLPPLCRAEGYRGGRCGGEPLHLDLARDGFAVACHDPLGSGSRLAEAAAFAARHPRWSPLGRMVADAQAALDAAAALPGVDGTRVLLAGYGTGALVAAHVLALCPGRGRRRARGPVGRRAAAPARVRAAAREPRGPPGRGRRPARARPRAPRHLRHRPGGRWRRPRTRRASSTRRSTTTTASRRPRVAASWRGCGRPPSRPAAPRRLTAPGLDVQDDPRAPAGAVAVELHVVVGDALEPVRRVARPGVDRHLRAGRRARARRRRCRARAARARRAR